MYIKGWNTLDKTTTFDLKHDNFSHQLYFDQSTNLVSNFELILFN